MNRDASDVVAHQLDLAGVQPGTDLESQGTDTVADRDRATDRARRAIEGREESVAGRVDLPAAMALELTSDKTAIRVQQVAPPSVTDLGGLTRRLHDVAEEHRREHAVGLGMRPDPREELLHFGEDGLL